MTFCNFPGSWLTEISKLTYVIYEITPSSISCSINSKVLPRCSCPDIIIIITQSQRSHEAADRRPGAWRPPRQHQTMLVLAKKLARPPSAKPSSPFAHAARSTSTSTSTSTSLVAERLLSLYRDLLDYGYYMQGCMYLYLNLYLHLLRKLSKFLTHAWLEPPIVRLPDPGCSCTPCRDSIRPILCPLLHDSSVRPRYHAF